MPLKPTPMVLHEAPLMPLAAKNNLDELYARQRLVQDEAARLETASDALTESLQDFNRRYILELQSVALREEELRLSAAISDILERDLQR